MEAYEHFHLVGRALWRWFVTRCYDSLIVGLLWFGGLWYLHVPWAALWAILGGLLHFIPNFGIAIALVGPAIAAGISGGWMRFLYVLILYSGIVIVDSLLIQPWLMKGVARVPFWISLIAPIAPGLVFSFWGVLLAPPILAVYYAYRAHLRRNGPRAAPGRW
ncbi:MAG TPA: AI-2E family transporter [Candidatus Acidoferrales bacterium]|nr:AI-2E family transporter [Candidatus Acidoferrales bacterium]